MALYKVVACATSCGWVLQCNGIGVTLKNKCPECEGALRSAQSSEPAELLDWVEEKHLEAPRWLKNSVPVG